MWPSSDVTGPTLFPNECFNSSLGFCPEIRNLSPLLEIFVCAIYTFLIAMGVVLNSVCVFVLIRQQWRQTKLGHYDFRSRNLFILNLTIADLLLCLIELPFTLNRIVTFTWHFGAIFCKLIPFFQATNILVAACTVMIIAIDRYNIIVRSPKTTHHLIHHCNQQIINKHRICNVNGTITLIWVFSMLFSTPIYFHTQLETIPIANVHFCVACTAIWPSDREKKLFGVATFIVEFLVPFVVISIMHWMISRYLHRHMRKIQRPVIQIHSPNGDQNEEGLIIPQDYPTNATNNSRLELEARKSSICSENSQRSTSKTLSLPKKKPWRRELRRNRRTSIFLVCIAAIFAASWLPLTLFNLYTHFDNNLDRGTHYLLFALCHILAMSSVCINPFLYGFLNTNFRKEFSLAFRFCSERFLDKKLGNNNISNKNLSKFRKKLSTVEVKDSKRLVITLVSKSNLETFL